MLIETQLFNISQFVKSPLSPQSVREYDLGWDSLLWIAKLVKLPILEKFGEL